MREEEIREKIREKQEEIDELKSQLPGRVSTRGDPLTEVEW